MEVKVGCDIVEIKRFIKIEEETLNKIFHKTELKNPNPETLAGLFAAKESCKKVFNNLSWHDIEIKKKRNGKPDLILKTEKNIISHDLSISHDRDYAIATVVFLIKRGGT
ncbi:MAG: holo-ACP synthase [Nanoarchaeota archaeon]|nr:holo-ACP synthase [Nanoarchaeota archaeon]